MLGDVTNAAAPPGGLQDFVTQQIVDAILAGTFAPGEKLSPTRLAGQLGVSHIPVRESLAALESMGQVRRVPRVGYFVSELSTEYVEDLYHWRQVLEDEAHRIAIPRLLDADIDRLRKAYKAWGKAFDSRSRDPVEVIHTNRAFHFIAFERAGSLVLLRFLEQLWDAAAPYQSMLSRLNLRPTASRAEHEQLLQAFQARDTTRVNELMATHRGATLEALRTLASQNTH
jgi:DNA-binding GntR family transcriptional regulator